MLSGHYLYASRLQMSTPGTGQVATVAQTEVRLTAASAVFRIEFNLDNVTRLNTRCLCTCGRWLLKGKFLIVLALAISASILSLPVAAHHGNAAYDATKQINLKGTVTQFVWANPHCVVLFDVTDESGQVVHWMAETENPTTMTNMGWLKSSLKPGDPITIRVITVKNGKPIGRIVWVETASGQKLPGRLLPTVDKPEDEPKQ
jgi:hypothetical protein